MASTQLTFSSESEHRAYLAAQAALPRGFRVGTARFAFDPVEVHKPATMTLTLLTLDAPTPSFGAMFTRNAFPGAPVILGRRRLEAPRLAAVLINNKISNVCAPGGVEASSRLCAELGALLGVPADAVLPSSTGVIGWRLPVDAMVAALPEAVAALQGDSVLPAAEGIVTTDLYPKVRRAELPGGGSIVGIAKGAGMIEPNLATMLVYLLTDADVPRDELRASLAAAVDSTFNCMSIDSDTSTSDTVVLVSSQRAPRPDPAAFRAALTRVCADLAEDVVRNGEGVHHVIRVDVRGAPTPAIARGIGKAIVNSPLVQCAVCGNDPNVGRLVMAIGKYVGAGDGSLDLARCTIAIGEGGGEVIFTGGELRLDPAKEERLVAHFKEAELYASALPDAHGVFRPQVRFPPHERSVAVHVDLGAGSASATIYGADRTHEYISENADYRS